MNEMVSLTPPPFWSALSLIFFFVMISCALGTPPKETKKKIERNGGIRHQKFGVNLLFNIGDLGSIYY
jgi:hypothetical protein